MELPGGWLVSSVRLITASHQVVQKVQSHDSTWFGARRERCVYKNSFVQLCIWYLPELISLSLLGFQIAILLRLSPIVPFNAINYILGVTSMRLVHYIFSLVGILPGTVLYCFIGATAGSLTESGSAVSGPVALASLIVGIVFGLASIFLVGYYAKKEFDKIVAQQEADEQSQRSRSSAQTQVETDDMV